MPGQAVPFEIGLDSLRRPMRDGIDFKAVPLGIEFDHFNMSSSIVLISFLARHPSVQTLQRAM